MQERSTALTGVSASPQLDSISGIQVARGRADANIRTPLMCASTSRNTSWLGQTGTAKLVVALVKLAMQNVSD